MSAEATSLVWLHSKTKGLARLIMLGLARSCERRRKPFFSPVSPEDLALLTLVSVRHVHRILKELVASGEELIIHHAGCGRGVKTIYHIVIYAPKRIVRVPKTRTSVPTKPGHLVSGFRVVPTGSA